MVFEVEPQPEYAPGWQCALTKYEMAWLMRQEEAAAQGKRLK